MTIIMLFIFMASFVGLAYWHKRENGELARQWKKELPAETADKLLHFAWSRSIQLLVAAGLGMIVILLYNWQLNTERSVSITPEQTQNAPASPAIAPVATKPAPLPPNNRPANSKQPVTSYYPSPPSGQPIVSNIQPAIPAAPAPDDKPNPSIIGTAPPPAEVSSSVTSPVTTPNPNLAPDPNAAPVTIADIYNPEAQTSDAQSKMDAIKKRYGDILVTYMFLKKCGTVNPTDYHVITSALSQEMASVNAPGRMQYDIMTAAQGSYKEIYANMACDPASIGTLQSQYNDYIAALTKEFAQ